VRLRVSKKSKRIHGTRGSGYFNVKHNVFKKENEKTRAGMDSFFVRFVYYENCRREVVAAIRRPQAGAGQAPIHGLNG